MLVGWPGDAHAVRVRTVGDDYFKLYPEDVDVLIPANRLTDLEAENARLREALEGAKDFIKRDHAKTGMCCCGDYVKDHNGYDGHEPVDSGFYAAMMRVEKIEAALNTGDNQ